MTYGQQLRNEGMQQGRQEGIRAKTFDIARSMLQDRESIEKIQRWTGLSGEAIRSMEAGLETK